MRPLPVRRRRARVSLSHDDSCSITSSTPSASSAAVFPWVRRAVRSQGFSAMLTPRCTTCLTTRRASSSSRPLTVPGPRHMAPDLLFHPVFNEAEALAGVSYRKVGHPTAKHWIDQLNDFPGGDVLR